MVSYKYPLFEKGRILKVEMLNALRDFPFDLAQTRYSDYSDGIICGFNVSSKDDMVFISSGIIKHQNRIYILKENIELRCDVLGVDLILKIRFDDYDESEKDFYNYTTEIIFDTEFDLQENDIEICRFDLRNGAKLRSDYTDIYDMSTKYDTVNIIHATFSGYLYKTVSPKLTRFFAEESLKYNIKDPFDINFCMTCLNGDKPLDSLLIVKYLVYKLGIEEKQYTNLQIYNYLCKSFEAIKNNNVSKLGNRLSPKRIIVD